MVCSFLRRLLSSDSIETKYRNFYCSSCGVWLATFDWRNGWRLTDANTPTLKTAPRERLIPFQIPQIYKERRNIKSITAIGKSGKVVVFNSTGTMSAISQAMYNNLERNLRRADAAELATDIAFEMMMQLRKSSPEETGLDEFQGRYVHKDYEGTTFKNAQLLLRDKWFYMLPRSHLSKQDVEDQSRLCATAMEFVGSVSAWDARWEDHRNVWYDMLWYLIKGIQSYTEKHDRHDAMQAYIITRRVLQKLNLNSKQDEMRQRAVELAMQYIKLMIDLKPWKKRKKKNVVDIRGSIATWWHGVLAQGMMHESPAETGKTLDRLVKEAEDWLYRVTPVRMIEYFIGRTMQGESATLIKACITAQTHGMEVSNWRRIVMSEDNKSYTYKKSDP